MPPIQLEATLMFGIVLPWIVSISMSSPFPDCLVPMDTFLSNLCKNRQAFYDDISWDEGCQIKGSEVCNMTIQTAMDQFPSLQGCVCSWEEELCDSIQTLVAQCHRKPVPQKRRRTVMDWQSSSLIGYGNYFVMIKLVFYIIIKMLLSAITKLPHCIFFFLQCTVVVDPADQMAVCVSDAVCNKYLVHVLQACTEDHCDDDLCQKVTQQFFDFMPHNVAEMLVMCECEASNKNCMQIKAALHSRTCGHKTWICQDTFKQCVEDNTCRDKLKTLRNKCWSPDEAQCSESGFLKDECFSQMDPALILGAKPECKKAFMTTLGSSLHYPCTCQGVHNDDLVTCNIIRDIFHNRSHFTMSWKISSGLSMPPKTNESEQDHSWSHDYILYGFAALLFVGVVVLMPLAVISKIWMLRRRERNKIPLPQKSSCVVIL
ncbi:LOW QUALITY PROTEIN: GDNF family receptor alpha-like [Antennarius striatus]|uniref:LOW QUALITY PROTEIN: GDNF family receptor alpha-like n=1 Tax=Antennarius striatus TaxID=241820 RepID=UPI0035AED73A